MRDNIIYIYNIKSWTYDVIYDSENDDDDEMMEVSSLVEYVPSIY